MSYLPSSECSFFYRKNTGIRPLDNFIADISKIPCRPLHCLNLKFIYITLQMLTVTIILLCALFTNGHVVAVKQADKSINSDFNGVRRHRAIVFRPLFVYRQEQATRNRLNEERAQRRYDQQQAYQQSREQADHDYETCEHTHYRQHPQDYYRQQQYVDSFIPYY